MNLCVFQGTFNPIHNAHINMANFAMENYHYDKIIFIPAYRPPHKNKDIADAKHRLEMIKLAIKQFPEFEVSDIEYQNDRISYTYLTIQELYKKYSPDNRINFIIGTDAFKKIETWYNAEKLKELLNFVVFSRGEFAESEYLKSKGYQYTITTKEYENISSSIIRKYIRENTDIAKLVPTEVRGYIEEYGLYKN